MVDISALGAWGTIVGAIPAVERIGGMIEQYALAVVNP